ncbi:hypothetical protein Salat_1166800 [Sesamum alatum]|uniref:Uncharacterized protein n=1 Tax=Sesamum alatum TaxID=300844 RepID=A0AAE1YEK2_9LAMI|nr:hypothetical protein Salat_1166800 [Sesamum alatum]
MHTMWKSGTRGPKSSGIQIGGEINPEEEEKVLDAAENEQIEADRSAFPGLTNEQWVAILNLLNTHKIGASEKTHCPIKVHNPDGSNYVDELNEYRCLSRDGDIMLDRGRMEDTTHEVETDKVSEAGMCNEANCENMSDTVDPPTMPTVEQETLGRGFWSKQPPAKFKEYVIYTARRLKDPTALATAQSNSSGTPYPIAHYVTCDNFSAKHRAFLAAVTAGMEPSR